MFGMNYYNIISINILSKVNPVEVLTSVIQFYQNTSTGVNVQPYLEKFRYNVT